MGKIWCEQRLRWRISSKIARPSAPHLHVVAAGVAMQMGCADAILDVACANLPAGQRHVELQASATVEDPNWLCYATSLKVRTIAPTETSPPLTDDALRDVENLRENEGRSPHSVQKIPCVQTSRSDKKA